MPKVQLTGKQSDFLKIIVAAAGRGDLETVQELVDDNPAWIHTVGSHGRTMLWEAAYRGRLEVARFLLERGADINLPGCYHIQHRLEITPYCVARYEGRDVVAEYLLQHGATIDIHTAAYLGDYDTVRSHLDNDPNLVNKGYLQAVMLPAGGPTTFEHRETEWATPLCYAIRSKNTAIVELLISRGAIIEPYSERFLDYTASDDRVKIAELLLENGADPSKAPRILDDGSAISTLFKRYGIPSKNINEKSHMGWPDLVYVCRGDNREHPDKVQRLLALGADIDVRNYKGKTALHYAAKAGFLKIINLLIERGAPLNATDNDGETPLFDAIRSTIKDSEKQRAALEALLVAGANLNVKNKKNLTPLQVAQRMRRAEARKVVELLRVYSAVG
ncbi:MAG: ankyrin repeat domain-containing protein [Candidatus Poribacteria bacterium]|nr:ankyrin repeat domain-containing protein [Candidatus Poribacteria bacterium]